MVIVFLLLALIITQQANAMGVAQDYLKNDTLLLTQGTSHVLNLYLQNPDDKSLIVNLTLQSAIAEILYPQVLYTLPPKPYTTKVAIKVTALSTAYVGDEFSVRYSLILFKNQEGGQLGMVSKITRTFKVIIVDENGVGVKEHSAFMRFIWGTFLPILIILLLLATLGIIFVLLWNKSLLFSKKIENKKASKKKSSSKKPSKLSKENNMKKRTRKKPSARNVKNFDSLSKKLKNASSEKEIKRLLHNEWKKK